MKLMRAKSVILPITIAAFAVAAVACSPEVGSEEWCKDLKEKPKGEWTANETGDFAKHCLL